MTIEMNLKFLILLAVSSVAVADQPWYERLLNVIRYDKSLDVRITNIESAISQIQKKLNVIRTPDKSAPEPVIKNGYYSKPVHNLEFYEFKGGMELCPGKRFSPNSRQTLSIRPEGKLVIMDTNKADVTSFKPYLPKLRNQYSLSLTEKDGRLIIHEKEKPDGKIAHEFKRFTIPQCPCELAIGNDGRSLQAKDKYGYTYIEQKFSPETQ